MSQPIEIKLPWPAKALHSNSRAPRMAVARSVKKARQEARIVAKSAGVGCWPNASILIEYWPPHRKYDVQNIPSSLKASLDGIADAMGCSDKAFDVDYPREWAGTRKGGEIVFRIYPNSLRAGA